MLKRLFKSFNRRITYIYHRYILLNLFIFPYLKKKNLINERFKIRYSFGGLILQGKKNTLKIGIGKLQTINKEHKLRLLAVEKWPILDEILVPHDLIQHQKFPILIIPTYSKINQNEIKNSAVKIFNIMKKLSDKHSVYPNHEKNENISLGLNMIKKMYTLDAYFLLKQIVKNYFANAINSYGFSHGDFHQSNIMIDFNKNLKLIDLDSIRLNGIQDFDALHFVLEHFWAKNSIHWSESISNLIINQSQGEFQDYLNSFSIQGSNDLYIAYFLDRMAYEKIHFNIDCPKKSIDALIKYAKTNQSL